MEALDSSLLTVRWMDWHHALTCLPIERSEPAIADKSMSCIACCLLLLTLASKALHKSGTCNSNERSGYQAVRDDYDNCARYMYTSYISSNAHTQKQPRPEQL